MSQDSQSDKKAEAVSKKKYGRLHFIQLFILIVLIIALAFAVKINRQKMSTVIKSDNKVTLAIQPSSKTIKNGEVFTAEVWVDSLAEPVNAVQVNLSYPTDKLEYTSLDGGGSDFDIQAQTTAGNGKIVLARGRKGSGVGRQLVAKVNFKAISSDGIAEIKFDNSSAVVRTSDTDNILEQSLNARYKLEDK